MEMRCWVEGLLAKFKITTLGCKVNQAESDQIAAGMQSSCWQPANDAEEADVCIINTCTVTGKASMQSRQAIRRAMRANPNAQILVTGCYAETDPESVSDIVGDRGVVKQSEKHLIPTILSGGNHSAGCTTSQWAQATSLLPDFRPAPFSSRRTRPFLKIQDGCDAFCTYCIVPHARGRSRSMPAIEVIKNLSMLAEAGFHEVVLSGIHMGCWGRDLDPAVTLYDLLRQIDKMRPLDRLRLSSIEPPELSGDIVRLAAGSSCICPHFHIPLQSGDNQILSRMGRPYTSEQYKTLVMQIHQLMPDAAIGADVLVGFPGESDRAFDHTCDLIRNLPLSYLHVFPFSARPGTPAAKMPDQVNTDVLKQRSSNIRKIGADLRLAFHRRFLNRTVNVLVETTRDRASGMQKGLTANYLPVLVDADDACQNTFMDVMITDANKTHLTGRAGHPAGIDPVHGQPHTKRKDNHREL
jgi:threonylcarbamoyladenosine tRNA methylthiotransferase MtaB